MNRLIAASLLAYVGELPSDTGDGLLDEDSDTAGDAGASEPDPSILLPGGSRSAATLPPMVRWTPPASLSGPLSAGRRRGHAAPSPH